MGWHLILVMLVLLLAQQPHSPLVAFGFVFSLFFGHFSCQDISSPAREGSWDPGAVETQCWNLLDCQGSHSSSEFCSKRSQKPLSERRFCGTCVFLLLRTWRKNFIFSYSENWVIPRTTHVIWRLEVKLWFGVWQWLGESWTCELSEAVIGTDPRY